MTDAPYSSIGTNEALLKVPPNPQTSEARLLFKRAKRDCSPNKRSKFARGQRGRATKRRRREERGRPGRAARRGSRIRFANPGEEFTPPQNEQSEFCSVMVELSGFEPLASA